MDAEQHDEMEHWKGKRDLLASGMEFSNRVTNVVQETLLAMIEQGEPTAVGEFRTNGGRRAVICISVDEDVVNELQEFYGEEA